MKELELLQNASPDAAAGSHPASRQPFDATELLQRIWRQNLPMMRDRVAVLEAAAAEALQGVLTAEHRKDAGSLAHKLAGSLGMFGYPLGTEISRELEVLLDGSGAIDAVRFSGLAAQLRSALPLDQE